MNVKHNNRQAISKTDAFNSRQASSSECLPTTIAMDNPLWGTPAMLQGLAMIHKEHFVQNKTFSVVKS